MDLAAVTDTRPPRRAPKRSARFTPPNSSGTPYTHTTSQRLARSSRRVYKPWPIFDKKMSAIQLTINPNPDCVGNFSERKCNEELVWMINRFVETGPSRKTLPIFQVVIAHSPPIDYDKPLPPTKLRVRFLSARQGVFGLRLTY